MIRLLSSLLSFPRMRSKNLLLLLMFLLISSSGICDITLPRLISDGAVLQRDVELKIWGWSSSEEEVRLVFNNQTFTTRADREGNWSLILPPQQAGGPYEMRVKGENEVILQNVLFGEVWLCSGQSNMELTMQRLRDTYPEIIARYNNPNIRQFLVPDKYDFNLEHDDLESGNWEIASPENIRNFSGVAFFFARELYEKYQVPIGLINAALGGSPVEAWMSEDVLREFPYAYAELQRFKDNDFIEDVVNSDRDRRESWYSSLNTKDMGMQEGNEWFRPSVDDSDWGEVAVPGLWTDGELGELDGVVWFRKTITVPPGMAGKEASLWLGRMIDQDYVYVNGKYVGTTGYQYPPRKYLVPGDLLTAGENTITIRLINQQGAGGFVTDKPYFLMADQDSIDLKGPWKYRVGTEMPALESQTFIRFKAGGLYNQMIAPLLNYHIRGVIWYQGESNTSDPGSYKKTFPALIRNWRDKWDLGDFPFLYVQLANFMEENSGPTESEWAELRQAQLETLSLPATGMAVTIDIGEWNDIHPLNKREVGSRLAQQAYKLAYGEQAVRLSPVPIVGDFSRKKVVIRFSQRKLTAQNGGLLRYFEISEDGKTFFPAKAKLRCRKLVVWNDDISNPVAVRYGWADNPVGANLYSKDGLPASPFELRK